MSRITAQEARDLINPPLVRQLWRALDGKGFDGVVPQSAMQAHQQHEGAEAIYRAYNQLLSSLRERREVSALFFEKYESEERVRPYIQQRLATQAQAYQNLATTLSHGYTVHALVTCSGRGILPLLPSNTESW